MRKFLALPFHVRSKVRTSRVVAYGILLMVVALVGSLAALGRASPYMSELAFTETSSDRSVVGEVMPASCVSGTHYAHYWGYNNDGSIDAGCMPVCGAGQTASTTGIQYRCSYYVQEVCFGGETQQCNQDYYGPSAWQNSRPSSCPPGGYSSTVVKTSVVETRPVYGCVNASVPVVDVQFK